MYPLSVGCMPSTKTYIMTKCKIIKWIYNQYGWYEEICAIWVMMVDNKNVILPASMCVLQEHFRLTSVEVIMFVASHHLSKTVCVRYVRWNFSFVSFRCVPFSDGLWPCFGYSTQLANIAWPHGCEHVIAYVGGETLVYLRNIIFHSASTIALLCTNFVCVTSRTWSYSGYV